MIKGVIYISLVISLRDNSESISLAITVCFSEIKNTVTQFRRGNDVAFEMRCKYVHVYDTNTARRLKIIPDGSIISRKHSDLISERCMIWDRFWPCIIIANALHNHGVSHCC